MSGVRVIRPTDVALISSNVVYSDVPEWSAVESCAKGVRRSLAATDRVYQSLIDANVNNDPRTVPGAWKDVCVVNRLAMLDDKLGTRSRAIGATDIDVMVEAGTATGVAVFEVQGDVVRFTLYKDAGEAIVSREINLRSGSVDNWYDWLFAPFEFDDRAVMPDLPYYPGAQLRVQIIGSAERPAECGVLVVGATDDIGFAQFGLKLGIRDFSSIQEDDFGVVDIVKRANAQTLEFDARLGAEQLAKVYSVLRTITASWCVFIVDDDDLYSALLTYGRVKDFSINLSTPRQYYCSLEIEGATAS